MEKFLAPGKGRDFCQLSVCQKPKKKHWNLSTGLRKTKLKLPFRVFTTDHAKKILAFEI